MDARFNFDRDFSVRAEDVGKIIKRRLNNICVEFGDRVTINFTIDFKMETTGPIYLDSIEYRLNTKKELFFGCDEKKN